jgi:hypothetical protein
MRSTRTFTDPSNPPRMARKVAPNSSVPRSKFKWRATLILPRSRGRGTAGGGGGGAGCFHDGEQRAFQILVPQDVAGGEAQDADALLRQPPGAAGVADDPPRIVVSPPVYLDAEPGFGAVEIEHEGADRVLAAETQARKLPVAQVGPEDDLGEGKLPPEGLCGADDFRWGANGWSPREKPGPGAPSTMLRWAFRA